MEEAHYGLAAKLIESALQAHEQGCGRPCSK